MFNLKEKILDSIFPRCCPVCNEILADKRMLFCNECFLKLPFVRGERCLKCSKEIYDEQSEFCEDCRRGKRTYNYGLALLNYDDMVRRVIYDIKYHNKREYIKSFASLIAHRYVKEIKNMHADALIPIPIHRHRFRQRGFNQALLLAEVLGKLLDMNVCKDVLYRKKDTKAQRELNMKERLSNLSFAFDCRKLPSDVKRIVLVDDIYTTGATIESCVKALKRAGALEVFYLSISIGRGND